ncbi:hypothetical protein NDU88_005451 [Pleurodeles waltl]|uniref:Uncharacterized protein n=1 Tax=Pleurodeles waltl TaxID=8319 RepID=A0AAV7MXX6_PLEWA|nr:hypothetical protein NDU88_005451 [Pleurodeles waltl]
MKADLPELPNDKVAVCSGDKLLTGVKMASCEQEQNKLTSKKRMDLHKEDLTDFSSKDGCTQSCGNVEKPIKEEIMEPSLIINELAADYSIVSSMKKDDLKDKDKTMEIAEEDLPVKPQKEWVHMDNVELQKLEWMKDLPKRDKKEPKRVFKHGLVSRVKSSLLMLICLHIWVNIVTEKKQRELVTHFRNFFTVPGAK